MLNSAQILDDPLGLLAGPVGEKNEDRRFSPEGNQTYGLKKIWESHKEIMRRVLLGQKNVEIAAALGITPQTVSNVRNDPMVREQLSMLEGLRNERSVDIAADIRELCPIAITVMKDSMQDPGSPWGVKLRAAMDLLDRGGHQAPKQVNVLHAHMTHEQIASIKDRARNLGMLSSVGPVEEAEVVNETK